MRYCPLYGPAAQADYVPFGDQALREISRRREGEEMHMDEARARGLLLAERDEVRNLLKNAENAVFQDQEAQVPDGPRDDVDLAQSLGAEGADEDIAGNLRDRLEAIERALRRLDDGTYGRSVRSGDPIPDERLEADPAAELTVEEARANTTS